MFLNRIRKESAFPRVHFTWQVSLTDSFQSGGAVCYTMSRVKLWKWSHSVFSPRCSCRLYSACSGSREHRKPSNWTRNSGTISDGPREGLRQSEDPPLRLDDYSLGSSSGRLPHFRKWKHQTGGTCTKRLNPLIATLRKASPTTCARFTKTTTDISTQRLDLGMSAQWKCFTILTVNCELWESWASIMLRLSETYIVWIQTVIITIQNTQRVRSLPSILWQARGRNNLHHNWLKSQKFRRQGGQPHGELLHPGELPFYWIGTVVSTV